MKVTTKQVIEFNLARNQVLREIEIFKTALDFAEKTGDCEIRRKDWLNELEDTIKRLNVTDFQEMNNVEFGYRIAHHMRDIEDVLLKEFSKIVPPFDKILSAYKDSLFIIFILTKITKKN